MAREHSREHRHGFFAPIFLLRSNEHDMLSLPRTIRTGVMKPRVAVPTIIHRVFRNAGFRGYPKETDASDEKNQDF